jgi:hypothetical protein
MKLSELIQGKLIRDCWINLEKLLGLKLGCGFEIGESLKLINLFEIFGRFWMK